MRTSLLIRRFIRIRDMIKACPRRVLNPKFGGKTVNIIDRIRRHIKTQQELELDAARQKELDIRKLHSCIWPPQSEHVCLADGMHYPCPTIQILDGTHYNEAPEQTKRDSLLD